MPMPTGVNPESCYELSDDFLTLDTVKWASVDDSGTGTNTANDVAGGQVSIVTAASDNDYHYMTSTKKGFTFLAGKPLWFEAECVLTEANTDDANIAIGLSSVVAAGFLVDNGGSLVTTFDGAAFYKIDGSLLWRFGTSASTSQVLNASLATFVSGTTYRLGFEFDPQDGVTGRITPWLYSVASGGAITDLLSSSKTNSMSLSHTITLSGLGAMYPTYGLKAGGANAETLKMNRIRCLQMR